MNPYKLPTDPTSWISVNRDWTIGRLRRRMDHSGWTEEDTARKLGIPTSLLKDMLTGEQRPWSCFAAKVRYFLVGCSYVKSAIPLYPGEIEAFRERNQLTTEDLGYLIGALEDTILDYEDGHEMKFHFRFIIHDLLDHEDWEDENRPSWASKAWKSETLDAIKEFALTRSGLADLLSCSPDDFNKWLNGQAIPSVKVMAQTRKLIYGFYHARAGHRHTPETLPATGPTATGPMVNPSILRKLRGILALAKDSDSSESKSAAAMAQQLMERYAIDEEMLNDSTNGGPTLKQRLVVERTVLRFPKQIASVWIRNLVFGVSEINGVVGLRHGNLRMSATGSESDVSTVIEISNHLYYEIGAEAEVARRDFKGDRGWSPGRTFLNSFRLGAVDSILRRLRQAKEDARTQAKLDAKYGPLADRYEEALSRAAGGDPGPLFELDADAKGGNQFALVKVDQAIDALEKRRQFAVDWVDENLAPHDGDEIRRARKDRRAYARGYSAGGKICLSPSQRYIGSPA